MTTKKLDCNKLYYLYAFLVAVAEYHLLTCYLSLMSQLNPRKWFFFTVATVFSGALKGFVVTSSFCVQVPCHIPIK